MKVISTIAISALLVACAAPPQPLATASGNPEVLLRGVDRQVVMDALVAELAASGATIRSNTTNQLVVGKRLENNFAAQFFFGSRYDSVPEARITYTVAPLPTGHVRVFGRAAVVTNPGSGFERVNDVTAGEGKQIQAMLERMKASIEGSASISAPKSSSQPAQSQATAQASPARSASTAPSSAGQDAGNAERLAQQQACHDSPRALLAGKGPGFEAYTVACSNGDTLMIRCEFGNCRALR